MARRPVFAMLSDERTEQLAKLQGDPSLIERVEELAEKANEGELTAAERAEYDGYIEANDWLTVLQAERIFTGRIVRAETWTHRPGDSSVTGLGTAANTASDGKSILPCFRCKSSTSWHKHDGKSSLEKLGSCLCRLQSA